MYFLTIVLGILSTWGTNTLIGRYLPNHSKIALTWAAMMMMSWGAFPVMIFAGLWSVLFYFLFGIEIE